MPIRSCQMATSNTRMRLPTMRGCGPLALSTIEMCSWLTATKLDILSQCTDHCPVSLSPNLARLPAAREHPPHDGQGAGVGGVHAAVGHAARAEGLGTGVGGVRGV